MNRRLSNQDLSWFLELYKNSQLDLDPPYQRRSVWTNKDRQYFLDTIFRNYPSPAIFLHKSIEDDGTTIYHVVDGKQRLETILSFIENDISIPSDFSDINLSGKKWRELDGNPDAKKLFWDYVFSVEMIDVTDGVVIEEVFARLNKNSRRLERQELRHARYDGWFIKLAESESEKNEWAKLRVSTATRARRMKDVQFISELMMVVLGDDVNGFDQDEIDKTYAEYDDLNELGFEFSEDDFIEKIEEKKQFILSMEEHNACVTQHAKSFGSFYSLWSVIALTDTAEIDPHDVANAYAEFMSKVDRVAMGDEDNLSQEELSLIRNYIDNSKGASTDRPQRLERHGVLKKVLFG